MRLHVVTFGCQMALAEGEELAAPLEARGFSATDDPEQADAFVLNTCTVREHAEHKALSLIGRLKEWKERRPERVLIVAGCAAERLGQELKTRFPHIDLVVGAKSIEDYPGIVEKALGERFDALAEGELFHKRQEGDRHLASGQGPDAKPGASPLGWGSPVSAHVTIMRGCNYSCSYCIVPHVRGRELYRPWDAILQEAAAKVAAGARELVLLGQTVNSWKDGQGRRFPELLRAVGALPGLLRLRFESPHPYFMDASFVSALADTEQARGLLHMPLQSGADRVLALMKRNYTAASFLEKAAGIRAKMPEIELSTDIIVGFPSETEADFERTLDAVAEFRPAWSYTFKYSPREGTEAAGLPDDVPADVKEGRLARLNALCDRLTAEALAARVGTVVEALDETGGFGRESAGFKVSWTGTKAPGRLVRVKVTHAGPRTLKGESVS
jgi:tRNA-2-methylthio-N6-dimethylallyladenosine synthase